MRQVFEVGYDFRLIESFFPLIMLAMTPIVYKATSFCPEMSFQIFRIKEPPNFHKNLFKLICIFLITLQLLSILYLGMEFVQVYLPYKQGKCETVYGEVNALKTEGAQESFEIEGVKFIYNSKSTSLGYSATQNDGGCIQHDRQVLRIDYTRFLGRNVIVSIYE